MGVLRVERWDCMRKSGVADMYVTFLQDTYEGSSTEMRWCAVCKTMWFKLQVVLL